MIEYLARRMQAGAAVSSIWECSRRGVPSQVRVGGREGINDLLAAPYGGMMGGGKSLGRMPWRRHDVCNPRTETTGGISASQQQKDAKDGLAS